MSTITGAAMLAGVIGWPVAHSRSPRLHNHWIAELGLDAAYVPLAVPPERFETALRGLVALGFRGANVTIPHKEAAFRLSDTRDAAADAIGAVNTVVVRPDGMLEGRNTDAHGFITALAEATDLSRLRGRPAVVLGAGGAARAAVHALIRAGAGPIRIVARTPAQAETLIAALAPGGGAPGLAAVAWQTRARALDGAALLVNATSLGMRGSPPLDIALEALPGDALVYDLVYTPLETPLLAAARAHGLKGIDGLGMLIHQAVAGFTAWFGAVPRVDTAVRAWLAEGL